MLQAADAQLVTTSAQDRACVYLGARSNFEVGQGSVGVILDSRRVLHRHLAQMERVLTEHLLRASPGEN
jgi:hypothetical protein